MSEKMYKVRLVTDYIYMNDNNRELAEEWFKEHMSALTHGKGFSIEVEEIDKEVKFRQVPGEWYLSNGVLVKYEKCAICKKNWHPDNVIDVSPKPKHPAYVCRDCFDQLGQMCGEAIFGGE